MNELFKDGKKPDNFDKIYDYKLAIFDITTDKNGYVWAVTDGAHSKYDMKYEIFDGDNLIANFVLENNSDEVAEKTIYLKEKMYIIDYDNTLIEVYDYKFE